MAPATREYYNTKRCHSSFDWEYMAKIEPTVTHKIINRIKTVLAVGVVVYLAISGFYLFLGQHNIDEAWYLYAGKLVLQGGRPYLDFAYTQTPLLPYVYGLPQHVLGSSLYLGRLTSIGLSVATLLLGMSIAHRHGGTVAALLVALLFSAFTYGVYYNTIVKTYALVGFCMTLTLWALSLDADTTFRYPLAVTFAILGTLVRLSVLPFALLLFLYALLSDTTTREKIAVLLVGAVGAVVAGAFILPAPQAAYWNLIGYHSAQWGTGTLYEKIVDEILTDRVRRLGEIYGVPLILLGTGLIFAWRHQQTRIRLRRRPFIPLFLVAVLLFMGPHFVSGDWHTEYLVPGFTSVWIVTAIMLSWMYDALRSHEAGRLAFQAIVITSLLIVPFVDTTKRIDVSGGRLPISELHHAAALLRSQTGPEDSVLALRAMGVVVAADRSVVPGMNMAQFSYRPELTPEQARRYRVVNFDMLLDAMTGGTPAAVLFTAEDWRDFEDDGHADELRRVLEDHYTLVFTMEKFGQHAEAVYLYVRNDRNGR